MADNVDFIVDFTPHTKYTPYSGAGASDTVPFDGMVAVKLDSWSTYMSKGTPSRPMAKLAGVIQDEDAAGLRLIDDTTCGSLDKNGEDLGRQLMDFLVSSGTSVENIQKNAAAGAKAPISQILQAKVGQIAYAEIQADIYDGKETSKVINWVTKERYEKAKAIGAHRKKRRQIPTANATAAAGVNLGGGVNGASAPMAGATAPAGSTLPML